ncbi:B3 domain-containing protein Os03g0620500-like [Euphorbia lathyris]|uniref:B3 domain-containing protein Os03g0620500-like n=1 Tax=Euphorbia lathyris TaxID=212925 RepID=UPI003313E6E8
MASYSNRNNEQFLFYFFKIILDDQGKMRLPRKFVRNYGHHLPSPVMLKVPTGAKWHVEIVKNGGEIWLQNGWREFADCYSIAHSTFLVFEYNKRNGDFNVTIFDKTATEINYPFSSGNLHEPNIVDEAENNDVSVEILDHLLPSRNTKVKPAISLLSRPNKKIKLGTSKKALNPQCPTGQVEGNRKQSIEKKSSSKEQKLSFSNPPEAAKKFSSSNLSFQQQIVPDCLKRGRLFLPKSFVKNIEQGTKAIMLEVNNRLWPVKLLIYSYGVKISGVLSVGWVAFARDNSLKLGDVCTFEMINNSDQTLQMKVSIRRDLDLCLPKVEDTTIEIPDNVLDHFSPSRKRKEKSTLSSSQPRKKMKKVENFTKNTWKEPKKENEGLVLQKQMVNKILKRKKPYLTLKEKTMEVQTQDSTLQSENPTFQITIQPSHLNRSKPDIPAGFARKYIKRNDGVAVLNVLDGKTWTVNYCRKQISGATRTRIMHSDWIKFVQGNHLGVGDTCTFELIDPDKSIFGVNISNLGKSKQPIGKESGARDSEPKKENEGLVHQKQMVKRMKPYLTLKENEGLVQTQGFTLQSENPTFQITVQPSHLNPNWSRLDIPAGFAREYIKSNNGVAVLNVLDGKTWTVNYCRKLISGTIRIMHSDWRKFVQGNHLQVGDTCTFELIDPDKSIFGVKISNLGKSRQSFSNPREAAQKVNPVFQAVMTSSHFKGGANVNVPRHFINNLGRVTRIGQLQFDNKLWTVTLLIYPHHAKSSFSSGWLSFARENSLKVGDVCSFELIDTQKLLIKVSISRNIIHV